MCQIHNTSEKNDFLDSLVSVQSTKSRESHCTIQECGDTSDLYNDEKPVDRLQKLAQVG